VNRKAATFPCALDQANGQNGPDGSTRERGLVSNLCRMQSMQRRCLVSSIPPAHAEDKRADERTRTAYPCSLRVIGQGLHEVAIPAYLGGFLCSGLLRVAPYCVRSGIRLVSGACGLRVANSFALDAQVTSGARLLHHLRSLRQSERR
jgi:hypothetical protein